MKSQRLSVVLSLTMFVSAAKSQSVLYREKGVSVAQYRSALNSSFARQTPMSLLEKRLRNEELPGYLQSKLDETLAEVTKKPDQAAELFEDYYHLLEPEPRSAAIREAMKLVLERMRSASSTEARVEIEKRLELLGLVDKSHLSTKANLVQREIQQKLESLQALKGGEDVALFWNGIPWSELLPITPDQKSQWILVSSQWQPRLLEGVWSEVSPRLENVFMDWVSGSCAKPQYHDLSLAMMSEPQALFADGCIADSRQTLTMGDSPLGSLASPASAPHTSHPWLIAGSLLAATALLLMANGKKLQFQRR